MEQKLKIAQVVSTFPPYRGGMGNVAFNLADNLSRLGYEVTVFSPQRHFGHLNLDSYFKIHRLQPQLRYGNAAVVLQLFFYLLKYDIVHYHYPFLGASLATTLAKLIKGKKQKLIVHYHMDLVGQGWKAAIFKIYNWSHLRGLFLIADKIIVTSDDYLTKSLIYPLAQKYWEKFCILPNGVNLDYFKPAAKDPALTHKYQLKDKKVILFVGALDSAHYFKGVNYLIKAMENLSREDIKLIIVGEGELRSVYEDMVNSYDLNNRVIFTGYVPDEELVKFYNLADIFVLPSIDKTEAFGMVLLEAMACAKPVVASSLPGVREVVEVKKNGRLFKPKDVAGLVEQLNVLLNQPELAKEYGLYGRAKVEACYSWSKITEELLKIYQADL